MDYEDYGILKKYLETTVLIEINPSLKIRLGRNMLENFKRGSYTTKIEAFAKIMREVDALGIRYPNGEQPCMYIYLVPNEDFATYLNYPESLRDRKGGGKPVPSFESDGFKTAYGASENVFFEASEPNIMEYLNHAHEIGHLIHSMFWSKDEFICEGFAEAIILYTMEYEEIFGMHIEALDRLTEKDIFTTRELMNLSDRDDFHMKPIVPNASCSFELPYISSYLFVRGCIEHIVKTEGIDKIAATQRFLEVVGQTEYYGESLLEHLSKHLNIPYEELLDGHALQMRTLQRITSMLAKNHKKEG